MINIKNIFLVMGLCASMAPLQQDDLQLTLVRQLPQMMITNFEDAQGNRCRIDHRTSELGYTYAYDKISTKDWVIKVSRACLDQQLSNSLSEINKKEIFDLEQSTASFVFEPNLNDLHTCIKELCDMNAERKQSIIFANPYQDPIWEECDDHFFLWVDFFYETQMDPDRILLDSHTILLDYIIADEFCQKLARDGHKSVTLPAINILQPIIFALDNLSTDPNRQNLSKHELLTALRAAITPVFK